MLIRFEHNEGKQIADVSDDILLNSSMDRQIAINCHLSYIHAYAVLMQDIQITAQHMGEIPNKKLNKHP